MAEIETDLSETPEATDTATAPPADDTLAQLAGEEIDRMLAEADADGSSAADGGATGNFAAPEIPPMETPADFAPAVDQSISESESASQSLDATIAAESAAKLAEPTPIEETAPQIIPEPPAAALQAESPGETAPPAPTLANAPDEDGPLPLYIRILEFLNSPLDAFPDFVREAMGKVAIATMVNAIGMLVYVRFFRHK